MYFWRCTVFYKVAGQANLFVHVVLFVCGLLCLPSIASANDRANIAGAFDATSGAAFDNAPDDGIDTISRIQNLASHPTWLRLLHLEAARTSASGQIRYKADIISPEFYLSAQTSIDPYQELKLTLALLEIPIRLDVEPAGSWQLPTDAKWCSYPSRFLWLQSVGAVAADALDFTQCSGLSQWASFDEITGLSLVQVSGFFANPGSAFGHVLLQVNTGTQGDARGLLDLGINFGASVPPNEGILAYMAKGLFGGYEAAFSDEVFYAHDRVYSAVENRDMWAHRLDLSPFQMKFILYHLWELKDAHFDYFFLNRNCAFYVAKMLEMVTGESFDLDNRYQYPPIELFNKVQEIDKKRQKTGDALIAGIDFIPSNQRNLYRTFNALANQQQDEARRFVKAVSTGSKQLEEQYSSSALDFLLQYVDYKSPPGIVRFEDEDEEEDRKESAETLKWRSLRSQLLRQRLTLPVSTSGSSNEISYAGSEWDPPAFGPRPSFLSIGVANDVEKNQATIEYSPYSFNALQRGKGLLKDASFELFRFRLGISDEDIVLDRFDIIKIEKLTANGIALKGERQPAWFVSIGAEQRADFCRTCIRGTAGVGIGRSLKISQSVLAFSLAEAHADIAGLSVGGSVGAIVRVFSNINFRWQSRALIFLDERERARSLGITKSGLNWQHDVGVLYSVGESVDVIAEARIRESGEQINLSIAYRF